MYKNLQIYFLKFPAYFTTISNTLTLKMNISGLTAFKKSFTLKKQTVLALAHLKDQLEAGDDTLLKRLGWTKEQALEFIRRWEKMFADANRNDPKAKDELEQSLKSLGLRPTGYRSSSARNADLNAPGTVRDSGRAAVPEQWSEAFEAFTAGLGEDEE